MHGGTHLKYHTVRALRRYVTPLILLLTLFSLEGCHHALFATTTPSYRQGCLEIYKIVLNASSFPSGVRFFCSCTQTVFCLTFVKPCVSVLQYGGEITCKGYISASTRCVFHFVLFDLLHPSLEPDNSSTGVAVEALERKSLLLLPVSIPILLSIWTLKQTF